MGRDTNWAPGFTVVYVRVTHEELDRLKAIAALDRVTLCQWIRECINDRLLEQGDEVPLLAIRENRRGVRRSHGE